MRAACNPVWDLSSTHVPFCFVHHDDKCFPPPRPLSSPQDGIYVLGKAHMRSTPSLRRYSCNVRLTDDVPLSFFREGSSNASSFYTSLIHAIDDVMSLALCPQVVSQAPQHFRSSERQNTCGGSCFARQSTCSVIFPSLRHV